MSTLSQDNINLAQSHMLLPSEAVPRDDRYDWAHKPNVDFGINPVKANAPWYVNALYPVYPNLLSWFQVYREAGTKPAVNSRVQIRNLTTWIKSKSTGIWTAIDTQLTPVNGDYQEYPNPTNFSKPTTALTRRIESDGTVSLKPDEGFFSHGWGITQQPNLTDLGGLCITLDLRIITDDLTKPDTRLTDSWVANVGADWWNPTGTSPGQAIDAFNGRFIKLVPEWRTAMAIA